MMTSNVFHVLNRPALEGLARALEGKKMTAPFHGFMFNPYVPLEQSEELATELNHLVDRGMTEVHLAYWLRLLAQERRLLQRESDRIDLVWTGREIPGSQSRDTAIVVQELFQSACSSVLIVTYAIDRDQKARKLFASLANRMDRNPDLQVQLCLNIMRPYGNFRDEPAIVRDFAQEFKERIWPGKRLPEVFYDRRSLGTTPGPKACLHAKCVVIDEEKLFITSANFTEAAHERNIEAGVLLTDRAAAKAIQQQFIELIQKGTLTSLRF